MLSKILTVSMAVMTFTHSVKAEEIKFKVPVEQLGMEPLSLETTNFAGLKVDIEFDILRQAANTWFDTLVQVINGITIPDFESGKNYMKGNHFYLEQRVSDVQLNPDVENNAVELVCDKLTAEFRTNKFRYHVAPLVTAKGHAEVDMKTVKIGFALQFKTQTTSDNRTIMFCDTVDVVVDIDRNDIKLHVSGNWLSDVGSIFTIFFKGTVVDLINDGVNAALS
jgi:hypothetical protein